MCLRANGGAEMGDHLRRESKGVSGAVRPPGRQDHGARGVVLQSDAAGRGEGPAGVRGGGGVGRRAGGSRAGSIVCLIDCLFVSLFVCLFVCLCGFFRLIFFMSYFLTLLTPTLCHRSVLLVFLKFINKGV